MASVAWHSSERGHRCRPRAARSPGARRRGRPSASTMRSTENSRRTRSRPRAPMRAAASRSAAISADERRGERGRVARRDEHAGAPTSPPRRCRRRCDAIDGQAGGERLEERVRESLPWWRRGRRDPRRAPVGRVGAEAGEEDAVAEAAARRPRRGAPARRCRRRRTAKRRRGKRSPRRAAASSTTSWPFCGSSRATTAATGSLAARSRALARTAAVSSGVAKRSKSTPFRMVTTRRGSAPRRDEVVAHRVGVGDDPVGDAGEQSRAERALDRLLPHVDVALGGDHHRDAGDERGEASPEVGADEEGLHDVEALGAHEARRASQTSPGSSVPPLRAGARRGRRGARSRRPSARGGSSRRRASKRVARQMPHELDDLLLGAADVELVDDQQDPEARPLRLQPQHHPDGVDDAPDLVVGQVAVHGERDRPVERRLGDRVVALAVAERLAVGGLQVARRPVRGAGADVELAVEPLLHRRPLERRQQAKRVLVVRDAVALRGAERTHASAGRRRRGRTWRRSCIRRVTISSRRRTCADADDRLHLGHPPAVADAVLDAARVSPRRGSGGSTMRCARRLVVRRHHAALPARRDDLGGEEREGAGVAQRPARRRPGSSPPRAPRPRGGRGRARRRTSGCGRGPGVIRPATWTRMTPAVRDVVRRPRSSKSTSSVSGSMSTNTGPPAREHDRVGARRGRC